MILAGCGAAPAPVAGPGALSAGAAPGPTAACPAVEGVPLPEGCAPYDLEQAMAQNDLYRKRKPISDESRAAAEAPAAAIRASLDALRSSGGVSVDAVTKGIADAGLTGIRVRGEGARVLFGAEAPAGGCVYGEVSADALMVDIGGMIMDGGCLPAQ